MARQNDRNGDPGQDADQATLLEIARLITDSGPDAGSCQDAGGPRGHERPRAGDAESAQTPDTGAPAGESLGSGRGDTEADRLFEALPSGLALCRGRTITRANTAFALAFGYPTAAELIAAGGLDAVFPEHTGAFEMAPPENASPGDATAAFDAVTRSGRKVKIPIAVHDISGEDGVPVSLLVLHPGSGPGPPPGAGAPAAESRPQEMPAEPADAGGATDPSAPRPAPGAPEKPSKKDRKAGGAARGGGQRRHKSDAAPELDFLAKISHEVRTPLNSIIGFAELMKEERLGPVGHDRYQSYIRDIEASGRYALSLINDLLDISKIQAGAFELNFTSLDVNEVIAGCVRRMQPQARKEKVLLRMAAGEDVPLVLADRRSVTQILNNLLSNAVKFTDPGGQVIVCSRRKASGAVRIAVTDNGIGMSDEEIGSVMQPFRQADTTPRKQVGTGLGLPLTKALAKANHANFRLKSRPASGTKVSVTFPASRTVEG